MDNSNRQIDQDKTKRWLPTLAAICSAGVLAGTFSFAMNVNAKDNTFKKEVNHSMNVACGQAYGSTAIKDAKVDSELALGIILLEPKRLKSVCDIVQLALTDAALVKYKFDIPFHNNKDLHTLANVLGIDKKAAAEIVEKTYAGAALRYEAGLAASENKQRLLDQGYPALSNEVVETYQAMTPATPVKETLSLDQMYPLLSNAVTALPSPSTYDMTPGY